MKEKILELIKYWSCVSFIELCRDIPNFNGEFSFYNSKFENLIFWDSVSQEGIKVLAELLSEEQIFISVTSSIVYLNDGGYIPTYPIATTLRSYKTTHWLPVTFSCKPPRY